MSKLDFTLYRKFIFICKELEVNVMDSLKVDVNDTSSLNVKSLLKLNK